MNAEKEYFRRCVLHYFHSNKTATEAMRIICESYAETIGLFSMAELVYI